MSAQLKDLLESFNSLQNDMRSTLDKQSEEIRAHGKSTEETGRKVAALDALILEARAELEERIEKAENAIARGNGGGGEASASVGDQFVSSEEFSAMMARGARNSEPVNVGSFFRPRADLTTASYPSRPHRVPGIVAPPEAELRMRDLLNVAPISEGSFEYVEETGFTNKAATVAEKALKPSSNLAFELKTGAIKTIAHWIPATRQVLADEPALRNYIDTRLIYGLKVVEDAQLLYGSGAGSDILGIMTNPGIQSYDATTDGKPGDNKIDAVRRAITRVTMAWYPSQGVVLNPLDWEDIETLKGDDGHYIWVNVTVGGERRLWRVPVVETPAINQGDFLTGAFGIAATLWDREQAEVRVSESHADFFIRNQVVILAEERVGLAVYRPEAFVAGTFADAPEPEEPEEPEE